MRQSKGVSFDHVQPHMMYLFVFLCISCVIFISLSCVYCIPLCDLHGEMGVNK